MMKIKTENNSFRRAFDGKNKSGKVAFMPFLVAGDPDYAGCLKMLKTVTRYADMLEIGFPYSDPLADGPTIQAADERSLKAGMNTDKVFNLIRDLRSFCNKPITALVYANLVYRYGLDPFYKKCARTGINGVLVPDVPIEESIPFVNAANRHGVYPIFMLTQTTTDSRLKEILKYARGYLYLVSVLGVTGSRNSLGNETFEFIERIKKITTLPVALGFGISKKEQIDKATKAGINGVIVGSAIIKIIELNIKNPCLKVEKFIKELGVA